MRNCDMSVSGDTLVIRVKLTDVGGPSSTGKTLQVSSTQGNIDVPGHPEFKIGLNVYTANPAFVKPAKAAK